MYSSTSPCPLPIKSLTSILKAAKVSGHFLLRDSLDPLVNTSVPHLKVGEWKVEDVVKQGEDKIEFEKVLGYHQHNRAGLGFIKQTEVPPNQTHDYHKLVSEKVLIWKRSGISQNLCSYVFKATGPGGVITFKMNFLGNIS